MIVCTGPQSPLNYRMEICKELAVIDTGGYHSGQTRGGLGPADWQVCEEGEAVEDVAHLISPAH